MNTDRREKPVVLVMDDAAEHREYARQLLEAEGYPVMLASTMANAIEAINSGQELMVAFIDIHMHGGALAHGLFGYIKRTASHRVIGYAWTGDARPETHLEAARSGAFRVFTKGQDTDDLILEYIKSDVELIRAHGEDDLTGLYNMRSFRRSALEDLKRMREQRRPAVSSVIFIDIDDFKQVNDVHGHLVGDDAIRAIGLVAQAHVRPGDHLCRKGGDELLLMTVGLGADEAEQLGRRLQTAVAALNVRDKNGNHVPLSISIGVADMMSCDLDDDLEACLKALIERADVGKMADKLTKQTRRHGAA